MVKITRFEDSIRWQTAGRPNHFLFTPADRDAFADDFNPGLLTLDFGTGTLD